MSEPRTLFHPKTERRLIWICRGVALVVMVCLWTYIGTHDYSRPDMFPRFVGCYTGSGSLAGVKVEITQSGLFRSEGVSTTVKAYPGKSDGPYLLPGRLVGYELAPKPHLTLHDLTPFYLNFDPDITEFRIRDTNYRDLPVFSKTAC